MEPQQNNTNNTYTSSQDSSVNQTVNSSTNITSSPVVKSRMKYIVVGVVLLLFVLVGAVVSFYYAKGTFNFLKVESYTEENFLSNIFSKSAGIKSAKYSISGRLKVVDREKGAEPYVVSAENPDLEIRYQNDFLRTQDIEKLLRIIGYDYDAYYSGNTKKDVIFPASLDVAVNNYKKKFTYYNNEKYNLTDPVTNKKYSYKTTENGKNFELRVTFETNEVIKQIKKNNYYASTTFEGNTLILNKKNTSFPYVYAKPPRPLIAELGESMRMISPDINALFSLSAETDFSDKDNSKWLFNINAEGSFGDLSYKVNADAQKNNKIYYFRINNMPALFGTYASLKGQWIKIDTSKKVSTSSKDYYYNPFYSLTNELPESEKKYQEQREKFFNFFKTVIRLADESNLVAFKGSPVDDEVDGRKLKKYIIETKKESIIIFYEKISQEINNNKDLQNYRYILDESTLSYLKSEEYSKLYDYLNKNITITLWIDEYGFPAIVEEKMRIVPPDTATQLEDKQIELIFRLELSNINQGIKVSAPKDAKDIDDVSKEYMKNYENTYVIPSVPQTTTSTKTPDSKTVTTKAYLNSIRVQAELIYDKDGGYGTKSFSLGSCSSAKDTLFEDQGIYSNINKATDGSVSTATCVSTVKAYAVSVPLANKSGYSWCVDSTGSTMEIKGKIIKASCE